MSPKAPLSTSPRYEDLLGECLTPLGEKPNPGDNEVIFTGALNQQSRKTQTPAMPSVRYRAVDIPHGPPRASPESCRRPQKLVTSDSEGDQTSPPKVYPDTGVVELAGQGPLCSRCVSLSGVPSTGRAAGSTDEFAGAQLLFLPLNPSTFPGKAGDLSSLWAVSQHSEDWGQTGKEC